MWNNVCLSKRSIKNLSASVSAAIRKPFAFASEISTESPFI
jgi:hypothetical protein